MQLFSIFVINKYYYSHNVKFHSF